MEAFLLSISKPIGNCGDEHKTNAYHIVGRYLRVRTVTWSAAVLMVLRKNHCVTRRRIDVQ